MARNMKDSNSKNVSTNGYENAADMKKSYSDTAENNSKNKNAATYKNKASNVSKNKATDSAKNRAEERQTGAENCR